MSEIDYDRIEKIATNAAKNAQHSIVTETVKEVLGSYGMHDPQDTQELLSYGRACRRNKQNMSRGFFSNIGGHAATALLTIGAILAALKGIFSGGAVSEI